MTERDDSARRAGESAGLSVSGHETDTQTDAAEVEGILALAAEIRRVDGNHDLGAAALAEALWPFVAAAEARGAERALREAAEELGNGPTMRAWTDWLRARAAAAGGAR